jgi:hypothetical protein
LLVRYCWSFTDAAPIDWGEEIDFFTCSAADKDRDLMLWYCQTL